MNDQRDPLGQQLLGFALDEDLLKTLRLCGRLGEEDVYKRQDIESQLSVDQCERAEIAPALQVKGDASGGETSLLSLLSLSLIHIFSVSYSYVRSMVST